ncbi:MAG: helix-turn-helix transcriptional regulator [Oscillospiraceae bacterium]|nr:helix-turn-helix transcriptional regulator [Oscillospiraceae bacterium]
MEHYERLRALREDADKKQVEVAEFLGVRQSDYSKMERGVRAFHVEHIKALCEFYQVSADYILGLPKGLKWPR